ncbi:hypothetical protein [Comamonas sp. UBA7840]|uniref:hypothetical protein n=1 Tax=Comamonas sp. UBA7840 TaxID=1946392 RepID=UPI00257C1157|nr:hypothetical protein [Comamonas sp. UBA7840]
MIIQILFLLAPSAMALNFVPKKVSIYKIELIQMNSRAYENDHQSGATTGFDPLRNA